MPQIHERLSLHSLRKNRNVAEAIAKAEEELDIEELRAFEEKMYGDIWNKEDYLNWMYENLTAIKSIMSETASIYVHLDEKIGHYVKVLLDEIFGESNFLREIIWDIQVLSGFKTQAMNWIRGHDVIYFYSKNSDDKTFNKLLQPHTEKYLQMFNREDNDGRKYLVAHGSTRYLDEVESKGKPFGDVWSDVMSFQQQPTSDEKVDYATQKPETLLERIISASSDEGMLIADFFGGSGVTAKVAHDLKRKFIHVDVGINSIQTTRDRLMAAGAEFNIFDIQDGVSLFRNPVQTMDKLRSLITGLKNEDALDSFWEGSISDSKLGMVPVYVPNLLDHSAKVLDIPQINRIINEAMPDLPDDVKSVIVYYVDIENEPELRSFMKEYNLTAIEIELRDLKAVLDDTVFNDIIDFQMRDAMGGYEIEIRSFISDRLIQRIDAYNQKKSLNIYNGASSEENEDDEEIEDETAKKKNVFVPITISGNGLELIEFVSLDCTNSDANAVWQSDQELKIDKNGYVIINGVKTKDFWDAKITSTAKPLRMKVRNIAGDESVIMLEK